MPPAPPASAPRSQPHAQRDHESSSAGQWLSNRTLQGERERAVARREGPSTADADHDPQHLGPRSRVRFATAVVQPRQEADVMSPEHEFVSKHQPRKRTKTKHSHHAYAVMEDTHSTSSANEKGCPYGHAKDGLMLVPTVPVFAPITIRPIQPHDTATIEDDPVAMLIQQANATPAVTVTAIADSGASYILL